MKGKMIGITAISAGVGLVSLFLYHTSHLSVYLTLAITFGTIFYHFCIRLLVGYLISGIKKNHWNYQRRWFQQMPIEKKIYEHIRIKKWKGQMFTFNPDEFDIRKHSIEAVLMATCQAEVVHEVNMVVSFIPVFFSLWVGAAPVFWITSILGAAYDCVFVMMQRFNRPRLMRLLKRREN